MTDLLNHEPGAPGGTNDGPADGRTASRRERVVEAVHNRVMAKVILGLALALTAAAWWFSHQTVQTSAQERFEFRTQEIETAVVQRMQGYETVLWSGVGIMDSSDEVQRQEWAEYVTTLNLDSRWPGIQGIGWAVPVDPDDLADHEAAIRAEGFPDYGVHPAGPRDEYTAIVYLEPFDWRNQRAFGYDMWSNVERRAAMSRARDTGAAATSSMITLVQETDEDVQQGFLTYVPVYEGGQTPPTTAERRQALLGWVYAPFRMNDLMDGILGSKINTVDFEIFDGRGADPDRLLYDSDPEVAATADEDLQRQVTILVQGRPWTMVFRPGGAFRVASESLPTFVAVAGLVIDALLFYVISSLGRLNQRARALAADRTAELRVTNEELQRQTAELQRSNDELRQFAHAASHDLQEPLRTMASYSSLVSSTYGDELGSEGQRWLGYITGGAKRLSSLLRDILQFSTLDGPDADHQPVDLNEVMETVARDLSPLVVAESAELQVGELPEVVGNPIQLQRLLANLIHNAVKYTRPGVAPVVAVGGVANDDGWRIHVRDNGIGIDPDLHDRIFEVFRRAGEPTERAGTGMGLAICRKIAHAHGGDIGVVSTPGQGAEFWFSLPRTRPQRPRPADDEAERTDPATGVARRTVGASATKEHT